MVKRPLHPAQKLKKALKVKTIKAFVFKSVPRTGIEPVTPP